MIPFDVYVMYKAVKNHFLSPKYDYHYYNGKTKCDPKRFDAGKEKYIFLALQKKYNQKELLDFFVANVFENPGLWSGNLVEDEAHERYIRYKTVKQSLAYTFKSDLEKAALRGSFQKLFEIVDGQDPLILKLVYQKEIHIETFIVLNKLLGFFDTFDAKLNDDIIWPSFSFRCRKLSPFIQIDKEKMKNGLVSVFP